MWRSKKKLRKSVLSYHVSARTILVVRIGREHKPQPPVYWDCRCAFLPIPCFGFFFFGGGHVERSIKDWSRSLYTLGRALSMSYISSFPSTYFDYHFILNFFFVKVFLSKLLLEYYLFYVMAQKSNQKVINVKAWLDGSVGMCTYCANMGIWMQIPRTHAKKWAFLLLPSDAAHHPLLGFSPDFWNQAIPGQETKAKSYYSPMDSCENW